MNKACYGISEPVLFAAIMGLLPTATALSALFFLQFIADITAFDPLSLLGIRNLSEMKFRKRHVLDWLLAVGLITQLIILLAMMIEANKRRPINIGAFNTVIGYEDVSFSGAKMPLETVDLNSER